MFHSENALYQITQKPSAMIGKENAPKKKLQLIDTRQNMSAAMSPSSEEELVIKAGPWPFKTGANDNRTNEE